MERLSHVLFSLNGRIKRRTWLLRFVALAAAEYLAGQAFRRILHIPAASAASGGLSLRDYYADGASLPAELIFLWPAAAIDIKRWHDMGLSGWLTLIAYAPILAIYALQASGVGDSLSGRQVQALVTLIGLIFLVYLIFLAARKGSPGANRFGPQA